MASYFYYYENFLTVFKKMQQAQKFEKELENIFVNLGMGVNSKKKQLDYHI